MTDEETESMDTPEPMPVDEGPQKTCEQVLEEAILDLIDLGYENGMTSDDVDWVLNKIINIRAAQRRSQFTVHVNEDDDDGLPAQDP